MNKFGLVAPLWVLALSSAFAENVKQHDVQVLATVKPVEFSVTPVGSWPEKIKFNYLPEQDNFDGYPRTLNVRNNGGGVQVRHVGDVNFFDEENKVNDELDVFVWMKGREVNELVPNDGTPLLLLKKSGSEDFNVTLWAQKTIPHHQRLTAGDYSAKLGLLFEVVAP